MATAARAPPPPSSRRRSTRFPTTSRSSCRNRQSAAASRRRWRPRRRLRRGRSAPPTRWRTSSSAKILVVSVTPPANPSPDVAYLEPTAAELLSESRPLLALHDAAERLLIDRLSLTTAEARRRRGSGARQEHDGGIHLPARSRPPRVCGGPLLPLPWSSPSSSSPGATRTGCSTLRRGRWTARRARCCASSPSPRTWARSSTCSRSWSRRCAGLPPAGRARATSRGRGRRWSASARPRSGAGRSTTPCACSPGRSGAGSSSPRRFLLYPPSVCPPPLPVPILFGGSPSTLPLRLRPSSTPAPATAHHPCQRLALLLPQLHSGTQTLG